MPRMKIVTVSKLRERKCKVSLLPSKKQKEHNHLDYYAMKLNKYKDLQILDIYVIFYDIVYGGPLSIRIGRYEIYMSYFITWHIVHPSV